MDLGESAAWLAKFRRRFRTADVLEISCVSGVGIEKLKKELLKRVARFRAAEKKSREAKA
jgi:GTP-binding protein